MAEMNFEVVRDGITALLQTSAEFRTIAAQNQAQDADEILNKDRSVEVFYQRGNFPGGQGVLNGPCTHECTFAIQIQASKGAEADLATIENPSSTALQIAAALTAMKQAKKLANDSVDECWRHVWQKLMAATSIDFGLEQKISSRWVSDFEKDDPIRFGDLVVISGRALLTFKVQEDTDGLTPTEGDEFRTALEVTHDEEGVMDDAPAAVLVENTPP